MPSGKHDEDIFEVRGSVSDSCGFAWDDKLPVLCINLIGIENVMVE